MKLNVFTDYSLRVLIFLAVSGDRLVTIQEIARAYDISENHLMKVVHQLGRAGVVETVRGKGGGMRLGRPAESIMLGEVVRQCEGPDDGAECFQSDGACCITSHCRLAPALQSAFDAFYETLDRYSLADIVGSRKPLIRILQIAA